MILYSHTLALYILCDIEVMESSIIQVKNVELKQLRDLETFKKLWKTIIVLYFNTLFYRYRFSLSVFSIIESLHDTNNCVIPTVELESTVLSLFAGLFLILTCLWTCRETIQSKIRAIKCETRYLYFNYIFTSEPRQITGIRWRGFPYKNKPKWLGNLLGRIAVLCWLGQVCFIPSVPTLRTNTANKDATSLFI